MLVAIVQVELFLPESNSLKAKRSIIRSLIQKLRNKFNVSVAEVDGLDKWQRATIGIAAVSNETKVLEKVAQEVIKLLENEDRAEVIDSKIELV